MKHKLLCSLLLVTMFFAFIPVRADYATAAKKLKNAIINMNKAYYYGLTAFYYSDYYNVNYPSLAYQSYQNAVGARNKAYSAWQASPAGSYSEKYSRAAYYQLQNAQSYLYYIYLGYDYVLKARNSAFYGVNYLVLGFDAAAKQK